MRVYISGRMTGHPDHNIPAFDAAENRLTAQGHFVKNPHRIGEQFGTLEEIAKSFKSYYAVMNGILRDELDIALSKHKGLLARSVMDADLAAVRSCGAIYLLRGWENSRGAKKELAEALAHGLQVMQEGDEE